MRRARAHGLSLVELMVALVLSAVLVSGLIYVFVGSKQAYRTGDALARVQESGRFGLEMLSRDLRHAGYSIAHETCGRRTVFYVEDDPSTNEGELERFDMRIALDCFDADGNLDQTGACAGVAGWYDALAPAAVPAVAGWHFLGNADRANHGWHDSLPADTPAALGDVIRIARPGQSGPQRAFRVIAQDDDESSLDVRSAGAIGLDAETFESACETPADRRSVVCEGDIVLVVDAFCSRGAVFQVTDSEVGGSGNPDGTISLVHEEATADSPGNRTSVLGADFVGGFVFRGPLVDFSPRVTYYLAASGQGTGRSLYRRMDGAAPEEMVSGIEGMIIRYAPQNSNNYQTAADVGNWNTIASARVELLAAGIEDNVIPFAQSEDIFFPYQTPADFSDRRLREAFRSTIWFRNAR